MNYDSYIQELIDVIKADTSIAQPWRNYCLKLGNEFLAYVHEGKRTHVAHQNGSVGNGTSILPSSNSNAALDPSTYATAAQNGGCVCTALGRRKDCLVHGDRT